MNLASFSGAYGRLRHELMLHTRRFEVKRRILAFGSPGTKDAIQRIYVINLDRQPHRWRLMKRELRRLRTRGNVPLTSLARRFSAVDARYLERPPDPETLRPSYSLADQLLVEPDSRLRIDADTRALRIEMTASEVAVALSHIEVWRLVAASDVPYTLVLEDDAYFRRGFGPNLDQAWMDLMRQATASDAFDLLYLSFERVRVNAKARQPTRQPVQKPDCGIWHASGYVLSRGGARKLLELLPAYGPVDLWLNRQFGKLDVFTTPNPIIEQRIDVPSTNSYSVLPVLSQVGVLTREKPLLARPPRLPRPVFAFGRPGTGLTSLATALSMLGYRCCSDLRELPAPAQRDLLRRGSTRTFDAYVNIGSLSEQVLTELASRHRSARFISVGATESVGLRGIPSARVLRLPADHPDGWEPLSSFLDCEYPAFPFPKCDELGQRAVTDFEAHRPDSPPTSRLKFDSSPWILSSKGWKGIPLAEGSAQHGSRSGQVLNWRGDALSDAAAWRLRDDTFPSNLAIFRPVNVGRDADGVLLTLRHEVTPVRSLTSGAIATQRKFRYGTFAAELRPSNVSGVITGMFLHRNRPHQEIDVEFTGQDPTRMLTNVYYNPGPEGTRLEYGYRGTPIEIDLGFDASERFHRYEIEWLSSRVTWRVDGAVVHERVLWDPTPIPNLPMDLNINLWHGRSTALAGRLDGQRLPAKAAIRLVEVIPARL